MRHLPSLLPKLLKPNSYLQISTGRIQQPSAENVTNNHSSSSITLPLSCNTAVVDKHTHPLNIPNNGQDEAHPPSLQPPLSQPPRPPEAGQHLPATAFLPQLAREKEQVRLSRSWFSVWCGSRGRTADSGGKDAEAVQGIRVVCGRGVFHAKCVGFPALLSLG